MSAQEIDELYCRIVGQGEALAALELLRGET